MRTAIVMAKRGSVERGSASICWQPPGGSIGKALDMEKLLIEGGARLEGEIRASGSKNAALPILAACVLTDEPITLHRIPRVRDIRTMEKLMTHIGVRMTKEPNGPHHIQCANMAEPTAPYDLVKTMRASSLVLGPLVARCGRARVSMPGGCAIGARPINLHVAGAGAAGRDDPSGARVYRSAGARTD